jgi:hypothetical protein
MKMMEFPIFPLDKGISLSTYVSKALTIVEKKRFGIPSDSNGDRG